MGISPAICSRRAVLISGAGVAALALASCTSPGQQQPALAPLPDDDAVGRAVDRARRLRASALALAGSDDDLAGILTDIATGHAARLTALGASLTAPASAAPARASSAGPSTTTGQAATASPPAQLAGEWAAAREALRDGISAQSPGLAVLLARIAAACASDADLLADRIGRRPLPELPPAPAAATSATPATSASATSASATSAITPSPDQVATARPRTAPGTPWLVALDRTLAGQHAAVFAYPLIIAQLRGKDRTRAEDLWQQHQARRNELSEILVTAGAEPAAASAAYAIRRPATPSAARRLAAAVELGLAGLAGDTTAAAQGRKQRTFAAAGLVSSARSSARWSGRSVALPGLPASTAAVQPSASTSPAAAASTG